MIPSLSKNTIFRELSKTYRIVYERNQSSILIDSDRSYTYYHKLNFSINGVYKEIVLMHGWDTDRVVY